MLIAGSGVPWGRSISSSGHLSVEVMMIRKLVHCVLHDRN